jgi:hypothetical protein
MGSNAEVLPPAPLQMSAPVRISRAALDKFLETWWLPIVLVLLIVTGAVFGAFRFAHQIRFVSQAQLDIVRALTPLAVAAVFIERAVEVLISPWRDAGADQKASAVKIAAAASPSPATDAGVQGLLEELNQFKGNTKKAAFLLGFILSLIASLAGVRALGPFLADGGLTDLAPFQQHLFWAFDVLLTAALLPGGADLVHTIFTTFSSIFNKVQKSASQ